MQERPKEARTYPVSVTVTPARVGLSQDGSTAVVNIPEGFCFANFFVRVKDVDYLHCCIWKQGRSISGPQSLSQVLIALSVEEKLEA